MMFYQETARRRHVLKLIQHLTLDYPIKQENVHRWGNGMCKIWNADVCIIAHVILVSTLLLYRTEVKPQQL